MSPKFFCRHKRRIIIIIMTDVRHLCSDFEFYLHWSLCMKAILGKNAPFIQVVGFRFEFLFYFFIFLFFFQRRMFDMFILWLHFNTHTMRRYFWIKFIRCRWPGSIQFVLVRYFPDSKFFSNTYLYVFFLLWKYSAERWKSSRSANDELEWFCVTFNYNNTFLDKIEYFRTEIDHLHTKLTFPNTDRILIARNVV